MTKYKVAILYICTGQYKMFWQPFYQSCQRYFLTEVADLEYFVFTDGDMASLMQTADSRQQTADSRQQTASIFI